MRTLIRNAYIVTVDENDNEYPQGALVIDDDRITYVGPEEKLPFMEGGFDDIFDADGDLVIPGIVNAHTHNVYFLMRGLGMDRDLKDWLMDAIWPGLIQINPEDAYIGSVLGCLENIRSGVTCLADNYYAPSYKKNNIDAVLSGIEDVGIRALMARGYHNFAFNVPEDFFEEDDEVAAEYDRIFSKWNGAGGGRIQAWVSPVNLLYSTPTSIQKVWEVAKHYGVGMHTHVAEARFEVEEIKRRYDGKTFIEVLDDLGVVSHKFHSVHSVHLSSREIEILKSYDAAVMYCPNSNMLLASGIAPVPEMLKKGLRVALGTDSPNNNQDMIESMKTAALLPRVKEYDPVAVTSKQALRMATIEGAKALDLDDQIGSLEVGKQADIAVINMHNLHNIPVHDYVANLVYSANQSDVRNVYIAGKKALHEGRLVEYSEKKICEDAQKSALALAERIKEAS